MTELYVASFLRLNHEELVHGVKYRQNNSFTWCNDTTWRYVQRGGVYVDRGTPITCIACLANQPTQDIVGA